MLPMSMCKSWAPDVAFYLSQGCASRDCSEVIEILALDTVASGPFQRTAQGTASLWRKSAWGSKAMPSYVTSLTSV